MPFWLIDTVSKLAGTIAYSFFRRNQFGAERRVRGFLLAPRFAATGLRIDRSLQIEGPLQLQQNVTLYGGSHFVSSVEKPLRVGANTHIGRNSVFSGLGGITIGEGCAISSGVLVYSITNTFDESADLPVIDQTPIQSPVSIGDDVWIGAGAIILPGVSIEDHAVVGAGAMVNKNVPAWQVVAGVPAKPLRDRREKQSRASI